MKHRARLWISGMAVALLAALALAAAMPATKALAAPTPGALGQAADKALANFLTREQNVYDAQTHRLEVADKLAAKIQDWIDKLKAKGKDTGGLEAGLAAFNTQITQAKAAHDQAGQLLQAKAGFNADGTVADRDQAHATVLDIRTALRTAHLALVMAMPDLRKAINEWRAANH